MVHLASSTVQILARELGKLLPTSRIHSHRSAILAVLPDISIRETLKAVAGPSPHFGLHPIDILPGLIKVCSIVAVPEDG